MSYLILKELDFFPEEVVLHICEFTGIRSRWVYYWKSQLINNINEFQQAPYRVPPIRIMHYLNQSYLENTINESLSLRINLFYDMLNNDTLVSVDINQSYKKMYESALQACLHR